MNSRKFLERLQNNPPVDGYLSVEHGFLPPALPLNKLSEPYSIWDQYAARIPELYFSNRTQEILEGMPFLSVRALVDEELPRAALVLSLLAHAYWRHGSERAFSLRMSEINSTLPNNILSPWQAVNERLGRGKRPFQSFYDLFFNNFKLRSAPDARGGYSLDNVKIENLDVLVPSFGNEAERVFYMSFVELHAVASPLVGLVVEIEEAIAQNDKQSPARVIKALQQVATIAQKSLKVLRKISPMASSKTYCDPILWSKTIAIFAVPAPSYLQGGTSGAFAPMALLLDALLNRQEYNSAYGQYVLKGREQLLPAHIVEFVRQTSHIDVSGFIKSKANSPVVYDQLAAAYDQAVDAYAGTDGFLGKHMSKAFNYLGISTMMGRNQSTSGHERYVHQQTWVKVSQELNVSRLERYATTATAEPIPVLPAVKDDLPIYGRLALAQHHTADDYWVVIDGYVYDLTDYLKIHPGGQEIMLTYASQDVSAYFHSIPEHNKPRMFKMMQRYLIGKYEAEAQSDETEADWHWLLQKLIFIRAIVGMQYNHPVEQRLTILFAGQTHTHFVQKHLPNIIAILPMYAGCTDLTNLPAWQRLQQMIFLPDQDLRIIFPHEKLAHLQRMAQWFAQEDMQLLDSLIEFVLTVLAEGTDVEATKAKACSDLVTQWLQNHLRTIEHIAQHVKGFFSQRGSQPRAMSLQPKWATTHGFSCPVATAREGENTLQKISLLNS